MELRVEKTAGLYVSDRGLRALAELVHDYSGICIGPDKHQLMANRLRRRVQDVGLLSLDDYGDFVRADATGEEIETLVDLMTTNHTAFFRESEHFTVLMQELAPTLRAAMPTGYPVRVWSAAASSGEEPYTLAMLTAEDQRRDPLHRWVLQASDISRRMLDVAVRGVYSMDSVAVVPPDLLPRYFERGVGAQDGRCRLRREVRAAVSYQRINLLDAHYPIREPQHVIFCRNVMIYFDVDTRRAVVERLLEYLVPGGYLVVGYSESLTGLVPRLSSVSHGVYTRS
ncbi:MAG: CheR family methyltransferase [Pseudomonadota bacterium]